MLGADLERMWPIARRNIHRARKGRYVPKIDVKQIYVENLRECIHSKADLKKKLLNASRR